MPTGQDITTVTVQTLEQIVERGQVWPRMAEKYGVANPVPPWKSSLDGLCDALDKQATALPLLSRRDDEDRLSQEVYRTLPFPESQLVALAHSLIARAVIDEDALASRMEAVRTRLEAGEALPRALASYARLSRRRPGSRAAVASSTSRNARQAMLSY
jgi:hypothetical protein